jgi:glucosamine-6-phosphate deaminase
LTSSTIDANKRFFVLQEDVPTRAISMGIKSIMEAQKIVLMAWGESKSRAVQAMAYGNISEEMPASVLRQHKDVLVIVDFKAAEGLHK